MTARTENARHRHAQRKKARRKLNDLYARQNSLCHWCRSACVIVSNIPEEHRRKISGGFVTWQEGDEFLQARMATVDHLQRLANNGTNDRENLVMACIDCNKDRTNKAPIVRVCKECGERLQRKLKGYCKTCRILLSIRWLEQHGFVQVPSEHEGNHNKFRDPETGIAHILRHACEVLKERLQRRKETT